jgi:O-antigen/teichoic acid export membrane protein
MGVPGLIYANLLSSVVILVTYALLFRGKITSIKLGFDKKLFKHLVLAGLPFGIAGILNILYSYIDRFILSMIRFTEVANYTLPYTLVMSLTFILSAYNVALFPMFSKLSVTKADSLEYACEKSFKYLLILILPICVGTTLLADRIINTIYGPDFSGSIPVLQILIWLLPFLIITSIGFPLMTATHRERLNMYVIIASAILNVILNLALIPRFGAIGSSFASLLTIGVLNSMLTLYIIRDALRLKNMIVPVVKVGLSSLAMAIVIVLVNVNNLALYIAIGAVTYFIMLLLVRGISHDDVDIAQRILFKGEKREGALLSIIYRLTGDQ